MNLKKIRLSRGMSQKELASSVGIDEPMLSKFENYKCMPIPSTMSQILDKLNCELKDVYSNEEIYVKTKSTKKDVKRQQHYKLTVRLPQKAKYKLNKCLRKCGYKDITYWIYRCYEELLKQYEVIEKAEKKDLTHPQK